MRVNFEQSILAFVEVFDILEGGCFDKLASRVVAPPVVAASQNSRRPRLLLGDCVRTVSAHVVESSDDMVFPEDKEDREVGELKRVVITWLGEMASVGEIYPLLTGMSETMRLAMVLFFPDRLTLLKTARRSSSKSPSPVHQSSGNSDARRASSSAVFPEAGAVDEVAPGILARPRSLTRYLYAKRARIAGRMTSKTGPNPAILNCRDLRQALSGVVANGHRGRDIQFGQRQAARSTERSHDGSP